MHTRPNFILSLCLTFPFQPLLLFPLFFYFTSKYLCKCDHGCLYKLHEIRPSKILCIFPPSSTFRFSSRAMKIDGSIASPKTIYYRTRFSTVCPPTPCSKPLEQRSKTSSHFIVDDVFSLFFVYLLVNSLWKTKNVYFKCISYWQQHIILKPFVLFSWNIILVIHGIFIPHLTTFLS